MSNPSERHDAVLSRIEQAELAWLSWGRVDDALTGGEALSIAEELVGDSDEARRVIDDLLDLNLLVDLGETELRVRSRFAEGVRLFARNRQLLPNRKWTDAAQLVNDFRV